MLRVVAQTKTQYYVLKETIRRHEIRLLAVRLCDGHLPVDKVCIEIGEPNTNSQGIDTIIN
ncbi:hypothetical protein DPMN_131711 [Dreissena polymorpha]|uniref:Uncharacterized protein n=1 Tax=Dreissena polymorpha TaxID=45954 RepID=A0A9D4J9E7_DREPO|nr:hypothetical protein DPMN_131711 [Dreissena polymorpha]